VTGKVGNETGTGIDTQSNARESLALGGQTLTIGFLNPSSDTDRQSLLDLHRAVFGSSADARWFAWKYQDGPGIGVGLWDGETMIAFCGGTGRGFLECGNAARILQIGDVMVDPRWRGLLTRNGPFFRVCDYLYSRAIGTGTAHRAGFGFPNLRHMRLAERSGLAWHAADVHQLSWTTVEPRGTSADWTIRANWIDANEYAEIGPTATGKKTIGKAVIDQAWANMRSSGHTTRWVIGERSWDHVRWRYLHRPDRGYRFAMLRRPWRRDALGVLVFSRDTPEHWIDWIGPPESIAQACVTARRLLAARGLATMHAWCSELLATLLAKTEPIEDKIIAAIGVPRTSVLPGAAADYPFWLMSGDTDFL
jgi:hypothetical protein